LPLFTCIAVSSPDSTSPALIGLPGFTSGCSSCAHAGDAVSTAATAHAQAQRLANPGFVM
jgi:hypothetical protein